MKTCRQASALLLILALVLVASSPAATATKCTPENTCTQFISQDSACDAAKCMADCVSQYKGAGEGQCFPQGCRCSYCCKPQQETTA